MCNLSLQYPYIIQQTGNENIQTYQVEVVAMIQHQIMRISVTSRGENLLFNSSWEMKLGDPRS